MKEDEAKNKKKQMRCHYCCRSWKWKMMIGRKIAICTFRKLKWMHWVDFSLPQQNPYFFLSNEWPSSRSRGSAVRKKTAEKKSENVRSIRSSGGLEIGRMMRLSQMKSKKCSAPTSSYVSNNYVGIISFHVSFRLFVCVIFVEQCTFGRW